MSYLLIPLMSILSRMNGGKEPIDLPWGLDAFVLAAPYLLLYPMIGWWVVPAYFGAVVGIRLGHGRGFRYDEGFKPKSVPERVEVLIPSNLPVWAQKALIMALTGLAVVLVAAIVLAFHGYLWQAAVLLLSGGLKSAAYALPTTEMAEYTRGFFLGCGLVIVLNIT